MSDCGETGTETETKRHTDKGLADRGRNTGRDGDKTETEIKRHTDKGLADRGRNMVER